jgi:endonuclease/exonuclease/phosphatase family metal-dependent hydrolase
MTAAPTAMRAKPGRRPRAWSLIVVGVLAAPAAGRADEAIDPSALEVATYNVQFVTPDLPVLRHVLREWPGHKPNVPARAAAIAARLACFDVVALQETINDQRRRELRQGLERAGRGCGKPSRLPSGRMFAVLEGPDAETGSWLPLVGEELALASRLPIVATSSRVYKDAAWEDVLAAKGVLHARLGNLGAGGIDVFVTHLQAGEEHGAVRRRQIADLARFIRATAGSGPVLVLGDLNVRGARVDRLDPDSDYSFLRRTLDAAVAPRRLADAWLVTHPLDPDRASGSKPRRRADGTLRVHEERIDHLLVAGATPRAVRRDFFTSDLVVDGKPVGDLSDHAALLAQIAWPARSDAAPLVTSGR